MHPARRHHFISQFYLRNFVADRDNPRLFVVDLELRKPFTTSPSNVALENDFHTISESDEPDVVEKQLSKLEAEVAPALRRIIDREYVGTDEDATLVLFFVALLLVKNPAMRVLMNRATDTIMKTMSRSLAMDPAAWKARIDELVADGVYEPDFDVEGLRQVLLNESFTIKQTPGAHMQTEFPIAEALMPMLSSRHWNFLRAREGHFVTCDRPVALMWADPSVDAPIGLALPNTRLMFPLTSQIAILGGFELEDATLDLDADGVARANGRMILNANRQVYARDETFEYLLVNNDGRQLGSVLADNHGF